VAAVDARRVFGHQPCADDRGASRAPEMSTGAVRGSGATLPQPAPVRAVVGFLLAGAAVTPLLASGLLQVDLRVQVLLNATSVLLLSLAALRLVTGLPFNTHGVATWRIGPWYLLWSALAFGLASLTWLGPQTESSIVSVLAVLTPYSAIRSKASLRILAVGTLLLLWIAVPVNSAYRQAVHSANNNLLGVRLVRQLSRDRHRAVGIPFARYYGRPG
jgi:hypothetical protein